MHLLNTTTKNPYRNLVCNVKRSNCIFTLEIQCLDENEKMPTIRVVVFS